MKVFSLEQLKDFSEKVLIIPPIEDFDEGRLNANKWYEDHKIRISIGDNQIVLDYNADTVSGLENYLKEQFEIEDSL